MFTIVSVNKRATHVELTDSRGCVHFLSYPVYFSLFQQEAPAMVPEMKDPATTIVQQEEGQDAFTGAFGLTTLYPDGSFTFEAYEGSYSYTIEEDGHISASLATGNEFHGTTQDFYDFMCSPIGFEPEEVPEAPTAAPVVMRRIEVASLFAPIASVAAPVATPAARLDLGCWTASFKNSLQKDLIGSRMDASVEHYTPELAVETREVFKRLMATEALPVVDAQHLNQAVLVKKSFDEILAGLKAIFTRHNSDENTDLFAYALFHLANSKLVGASPAEKWAILRDLFLPPVA